MRLQQKIWEKEHKTQKTIPGMASFEPSSGVVRFLSFLKEHRVTPPKRVVDIGCGKGRNAVYLAQHGFHVYGMDYIPYALHYSSRLADKHTVGYFVHLLHAEIDKRWPFIDQYFDIAVDCYSSIDIETKSGREIYRDELFRTLKPEGYALIMVPSVEDEWESQLIRDHPGKERNSTFWPQNGKFQKDYDEDELLKFYKKFEIIDLQTVRKKAFKLNKHYTSVNYWMIIRRQK